MLIERSYYYKEEYDMMIHFYEDVDGIWYDYEDISYILEYSDYKTGYIYDNDILDSNKKTYKIKTEDKYGQKRINEHRFINTLATFELIRRNEERNNRLRNMIKIIEKETGLLEPNDSNNHILKVNLNLMKTAIDNNEIETLICAANEVYNSPAIQDIINTPEYYGERSFLYDECMDDELKDIINNAIDNDELEYIDLKFKIDEGPIRYRKHKKLKGESKCPDKEWFRELI